MIARSLRILVLALVAIALTGVPAAAAPARPIPADVTTTDVIIPIKNGKPLYGTVFAPRNAAGPLPGLVLVHGSGNGKRTGVTPEAIAFARQGIAVLAYDKRPLGDPDYSLLADDVVAATGVLREQPGVRPDAVGLWGISEGGWVMPIAASRSRDIAFLVLASAPGLSPLRVQNWNMRNKLAAAGVSGALRDTLSDRFYRLADDAGLFAEASHDPRPPLAGVTQPVLAVYGTADTQVPAAESAAVLRRTVGGPLTVRFLPGAGHTLRVLDGTGMFTDALYPSYPDIVGGWVRAVGAGKVPPPRADPSPVQQATSTAVTPSAWWESWPAQLAVLAVLLVGFLSYPVVALVRRVRRRPVAVARPARLLAAVGATAVLGFVAYFVTVADSANWKGISPGPMVAGRPVFWLALQAVALITVITTAMTIHAWRTSTADRPRQSLLIVAGVLFLPWALYWGLLLP
ncbi:alpha/beta hydrolase [Actinoplanes oblitus]|uniref:Alpha/beta hydrolase n=1 Tax=Actinoplanes oblitus TaxID=3040509 RepID=A0ABY8WH45_9ACTN|nr:alpha/beta hydrolase [Actinoplanes oblitus]WIM96378.1 alpha/beta hydrolase [Actinoplanes oblitus]